MYAISLNYNGKPIYFTGDEFASFSPSIPRARTFRSRKLAQETLDELRVSGTYFARKAEVVIILL